MCLYELPRLSEGLIHIGTSESIVSKLTTNKCTFVGKCKLMYKSTNINKTFSPFVIFYVRQYWILNVSIIAIASFKGGVGKTTTAICLATLYADLGATVLIDADQNSKSAQVWAAAGKLPFDVLDDDSARKALMQGKYQHVIIDSQVTPNSGEVAGLCKGSDLLIVPTMPRQLDLAAAIQVFGEVPREQLPLH